MGRMGLIANMQMERPRVVDCYDKHQLTQGLLTESAPPLNFYSVNSSPAVLQPGSFSSGGARSSGGGGLGYIEHTVSKFDTLVGVAIKYGVEVVDIKRMNGLTTDQQMFALKSLRIPQRGRHPPSPLISNGSTKLEETHASDRDSDLFNLIKSLKLSSSCQRKGSPCINNLQNGYGCKSNDIKRVGESFEMCVYREGSAHYSENEHKTSHASNQKSKFLVKWESEKAEVSLRSDKNDGFHKYFEKMVRRRNGRNTIQ